jgi:hypothetical protein
MVVRSCLVVQAVGTGCVLGAQGADKTVVLHTTLGLGRICKSAWILKGSHLSVSGSTSKIPLLISLRVPSLSLSSTFESSVPAPMSIFWR